MICPVDRGRPACPTAAQSAPFGGLPAGAPGTVHPSIVSPSASKPVSPAVPGTSMSSIATPGNCTDGSLAYEIDTCTSVPA